MTNRLTLMVSTPVIDQQDAGSLNTGLAIEFITTLSDYRSFMDRSGVTPNKFASRRFENGATFLGLLHGGTLVSWLWVSATGGSFPFLEIGRALSLADDERVLFDVETRATQRGKGFAAHLIREAQRRFPDDCMIAYVLTSNTASLRALTKGGFRPVGEARWFMRAPLALVRRARHG